MSALYELCKKFFVQTLKIFSSFLYSIYGLITGRRQVETSRPELGGDPLHVKFRQSVVDKNLNAEEKPTFHRRPTSAKNLLSTPLQELIDDSDDSDGIISINSLASSSSFGLPAKVPEKSEQDDLITKTPKKEIKFANDKGTLSANDEKKPDGARTKKNEDAAGVTNSKKRVSILDDDTLPVNVQQKLGKFINNLPKATATDFQKTFDEIVIDFPRFRKIKAVQIYDVLKRDEAEFKRLPMDAAAEKLMEALCTCKKHDKH